MEDNNKPLAVVEKNTEETRVCRCCGKTLPLSSFFKAAKGYRHVCISCCRGNKTGSIEFSKFTSRQLMEELRNRGYKGTLKYVVVDEITL